MEATNSKAVRSLTTGMQASCQQFVDKNSALMLAAIAAGDADRAGTYAEFAANWARWCEPHLMHEEFNELCPRCREEREQQSPPAPCGCGCELADKGVHVVGCGEVK
jgi:hypothetical protein